LFTNEIEKTLNITEANKQLVMENARKQSFGNVCSGCSVASNASGYGAGAS
jgi:hypothetical protein